MAKRKKKNKKLRAALAVAAVCVVLAGAVLLTQEHKLRTIGEEQAKLQEVIQAQEEEKSRLEYMIEYTQNDAYLIQYAREKLGYVEKDEIKFDIKD